jgi:predicted 3-demethylubiquinone-9 3-methyltransferase (glyoxalase superfamily)
MQKITTFLWFDDRAEEAANFYISVFAKRAESFGEGGASAIREATRYGDSGPGTPGQAMVVSFTLDGQEFIALNAGPEFHFTEAISLFVDCGSQDEVDFLWTALTEGGEESMCGWLKDRYGLSWQIIPRRLMELQSDPDPERASRTMQAMLKMQKIDVAELERAANG